MLTKTKMDVCIPYIPEGMAKPMMMHNKSKCHCIEKHYILYQQLTTHVGCNIYSNFALLV